MNRFLKKYMSSANDFKKDDCVVFDGEPYVILDREHIHMQQQRAVVRFKVKNLKTGKVLEKSFQSSQILEEADIDKKKAVFIYSKKEEYWFYEIGDKSKRFFLEEKAIGEKSGFLKPNMEVATLIFEEEVIDISLPIKAEYKVVEAPPVIKGATAAGGNKQATIETGAIINVPMFIKEGDIIIINTEKGEYVSRAN